MFSLLLSMIVSCSPPELAQDTTAFAEAVYREMDSSDNVVFSPYSLFSCLSMVLAGAQENTALEMHKALQLTSAQKALPRLYRSMRSEIASDEFLIANALWANRGTFFLSDFSHTLQENYDAKFQAVDFNKIPETVSIINGWTANQTQGKIEKLVQEGDINGLTRLVLTNAAYFKGDWELPFSVSSTISAPFHITEETVKEVPMMRKTAHFPYFENDQVQVLGLPFTNKKTACVIVLPKEGYEVSFSSADYKEWVCHLAEENVAVSLPSFSLIFRLAMNDLLQKLGMQEAFTSQANFSGINGMRNLFLSKVVHEALFILNESGVVASAATSGALGIKSAAAKLPPISFNADHPFLFMIIDLKTQTPLFLGKLQAP